MFIYRKEEILGEDTSERKNNQKNFMDYLQQLGVKSPSGMPIKPLEQRIECIRNKYRTDSIQIGLNTDSISKEKQPIVSEDNFEYLNKQTEGWSKCEDNKNETIQQGKSQV